MPEMDLIYGPTKPLDAQSL